MQTALLPFVLLWLCGHYQQQTAVCASLLDFPQPFLTVDPEAKVLRLNCTPPPEKAQLWDTVYKILIKVQLDGKDTNTSVAVLQPGKTAQPGDLENFVGDIDSDRSSLAVTMALEGQFWGQYYCDIEYSMPTTDNPSKTFIYSKKVYVTSNSPPRGSSETFAHIDVVDKVRVVWHHPKGKVFSDVSVYRYYMNKAGNPVSEWQTLYHFFNDKVADQMLKHSAGVLLASFRQLNSNYTITIHVTPNTIPSHTTSYTCKVPYTGCYGDNEDKCSCGPHGAKPVSKSELSTGGAVAIGLGILVAILIGLAILCFVLARRRNIIVYKLLKIQTKERKERPKKMQGRNKNDPSANDLLPKEASGCEGPNTSGHLSPMPGPSCDGSCAGQGLPQLSQTNQANVGEPDPVEIVDPRSSDSESDADMHPRNGGSTHNSRNHQAQVHSSTFTLPATANTSNAPEDASRNAVVTPAHRKTPVNRNTFPESASSNASPPPSSAEVKQPIGGETRDLELIEEDNQETDDRSQAESKRTERPRQVSVQESSGKQGIRDEGSGASTAPLPVSHDVFDDVIEVNST